MRHHLLLSSLGLLVVSHSLAGCLDGPSHFVYGDARPVDAAPAAPDTSAPDVPGAASFRYNLSRGCSFTAVDACPLDRPLMAGVTETISVRVEGAHHTENVTVASSAPSVLDVEPHAPCTIDGTALRCAFGVVAGAPGSATVSLSRGTLTLATAVVRVAFPARLAVVAERDESPTATSPVEQVALHPGDRWSLDGVAYDDDGEALYANDGVEWTVPDTQHVSLTWSSMSGARVLDDHVYVVGRAAGAVVLTARAGGVATEVPVEVR